MTITSIAVALFAALAVFPDDVAAKSFSRSTHHGETKDTESSLSLPSSLTSLSVAWLKQQKQKQNAAVAAGLESHHHHMRWLQLQDENTGERLDSASPSSPSQAGSKTTTCTTCSFPQVYTFRLALNNNCSTSTLKATTSYLLSGAECLMSESDMLPTYISSIHFLEFDNTAYLNVIHKNTTYLNNVTFYDNEMFTLPSSIVFATTNTTTTTISLTDGDKTGHGTYTLPGAAGLFLFGNDENGQPTLRSQIVWTFGTPGVGDCANATEVVEGKSLGWVIFEEVVSTDREFCLDSSSSPSPSSSSSMSPSTMFFVSASPQHMNDSSLPSTLAHTTTAPMTEVPTLTKSITSPVPTTTADTLPTIISDSSSSPTTATTTTDTDTLPTTIIHSSSSPTTITTTTGTDTLPTTIIDSSSSPTTTTTTTTTDTNTLPTTIIVSSSSPTTTTGIGVDVSKSSKSAPKSKTSKVSSKKKENGSDDDGSSSPSKTAKTGTI